MAQAPRFSPTVVKERRRKIGPVALKARVRDYSHARLKDRARHFGVHTSAIGFALKRLKITVKKTVPLPSTRPLATPSLSSSIAASGAAAIIYLDESGFEPDYPQEYAWSLRGQVIYGERSSQRRPRQNLLAARQVDALLAPMIIAGSVTAAVFERWLAEHLCRELSASSVLSQGQCSLSSA